MRKRFGDILLDAKVVSEETLDRALVRQRETGNRLGETLEEMGILTAEDIAAVLSRQFGFKMVRDICRHGISTEALEVIVAEEALEKQIFPLKLAEKTLFLAMVNPLDIGAVDEVAFRTGFRIVPCVTTAAEVEKAVEKHYLEQARKSEEDRCSILVVEDGKLVRAATVETLEKEGFRLFEASNGLEGLEIARRELPHLILTDSLMPRMDGYEMFQALQKDESTCHIPVIGFSSRSSAEEEARLLDTGYVDFVAKPINPVRLMARIRRALRLVYGEDKVA